MDLPGAVRTYAQVDGQFTTDKWLQSFQSGKVYVTNSPFLEFFVNGQPIGPEIHVSPGDVLDIVSGGAPGSVPSNRSPMRKGLMRFSRRMLHGACFATLAGCTAGSEARPADADPPPIREPRYVVPIDWELEGFSRVLFTTRSELGLSGGRVAPEQITLAGRSCVVASLLAFDVEDDYAFDIDEPVELTLVYAPEGSAPLIAVWDQNGGDGMGRSEEVQPEPGAELRTVTLTLDRARFAGMGVQGTDLAVGGRGGPVTLCGIEVQRSGTTVTPAAAGTLRLDIRDASGAVVAARVGLQDATGRAPLPSDEAFRLQRYTDEAPFVWVNDRTFWPSENRLAFYVDGSYEATLPSGRYDLVVTRGIEYRSHRSQIDIRPGESQTIAVTLERYADLPAAGWYGGESHIHHWRGAAEARSLLVSVAAEGLHIGNILEMGNVAGTYYKQPAWGEQGRYEADGTTLVSGQEDPRSVVRGHTIHWNIQYPTRDPDSFFHYHRVFEETRRQNGITGYAHRGELFNGRRGLALDVPFGLVDFIEVLQGGEINTEIWYSFLNLGYKILPAAGADFPYFGPTLPGVERTYVKLDGPFSADAWFEGFRNGGAYVTSGPFLEFSVNGQQMGSELTVAPGATLEVVAEASQNPDIGPLDRLEIIVNGEVVAMERANGRDRVRLTAQVTADRGMWIAARGYGESSSKPTPSGPATAPVIETVAHSAPVFILAGDEPSWNYAEVPRLVALHRAQLQQLLTDPPQPDGDLESWETRETLVEQWERQRPELQARITEADRHYQTLLDRHTALRGRGAEAGQSN